MEIYFDKETRKILRYIKRHPNNKLSDIRSKFGGSDVDMDLINLCIADYLVCKHPDGKLTMFKDKSEWVTHSEDNFWISPKGKKVLEDRFDRLWQWAIPTLISMAALIISILSALYPGVIRVLLIE